MTDAIPGKRWFRPAIHPRGNGIISAYMNSNSEEINKQRHQDLWEDLTFLGYKGLKSVKGEWRNVPEIAISVPNVALTDLKNLSSRYGQDAFVWQEHIYSVRMANKMASSSKIASQWLGQNRQKLERALRELDLDPNDPRAKREIERHKKMLTPEYLLTDKDWKDLVDVFGKRLAQELWKGYEVETIRYDYWPEPPWGIVQDLEDFVEQESNEMMENYMRRNPYRRNNWDDPGYAPPEIEIPVTVTLWGHANTDSGIQISSDNSHSGEHPPKGSFVYTTNVELEPDMDFEEVAETLIEGYRESYMSQYGGYPYGKNEKHADYIGAAPSLEQVLREMPYKEFKWDRADKSQHLSKRTTFSTKIRPGEALTESSVSLSVYRLDNKELTDTEIKYIKKMLKI